MLDADSQCVMPITGKNRHCRRPRVTGTNYCYQHQREPEPTEQDRLAVLETLAAPGVFSMPMFDLRDRILAAPTGDARTKEHRQWTLRSLTLFGACIELYREGLVYEAVPADGVHPGEMRLTETGREFLARIGS